MTKELAIQLLESKDVWLTSKGREELERIIKGDHYVSSNRAI